MRAAASHGAQPRPFGRSCSAAPMLVLVLVSASPPTLTRTRLKVNTTGSLTSGRRDLHHGWPAIVQNPAAPRTSGSSHGRWGGLRHVDRKYQHSAVNSLPSTCRNPAVEICLAGAVWKRADCPFRLRSRRDEDRMPRMTGAGIAIRRVSWYLKKIPPLEHEYELIMCADSGTGVARSVYLDLRRDNECGISNHPLGVAYDVFLIKTATQPITLPTDQGKPLSPKRDVSAMRGSTTLDGHPPWRTFRLTAQHCRAGQRASLAWQTNGTLQTSMTITRARVG